MGRNTMRKGFARIFKKAVCATISASIFCMPTWAIGGETNMSAIGKETQQYGMQLGESALKNFPSVSGSNVTIPMGDKNVNMTTQDLMPQGNSDSSSVKYLYGSDHINTIQGYHNSSPELNDKGETAKENLLKDSQSEHPTIEGAVYGILTQMANMNRQDMSDDPMLDATKDLLDKLDPSEFADCKADTQIIANSSVEHIPDYKHCSQVLDRSGSCKIFHSYDAGVIRHYDGPYNLDNCGKGCTQLWIGKVGDNYWSGSCKIFEQWTQVYVPNPEAITKAVLEYAKWDDYMQVWVGPPGKEELVWGGPYGTNTFPPETAGACELSTSWERNPNVDLTKYFRNVNKDDVVSFKIRVSVTGGGEGFGRIKVYFDPDKAVHDESWTPNSCLESAYGVQDSFASGSVKCISMPEVQSNGCAWIDGVEVCPDMLNPSPLLNIPNLCKEVEVNADFDFYKGQMDCWVDAQGQTQCPVNNGGNLDSCTKYRDNPKCGFISSVCVDGAQGASGQCYVNDVTYDCGEDVVVDNSSSETTYNCPGDIACMGSECLDTTTTVSKDFGKVYALMNAAQYMTQDMTCTGRDGSDNPTHADNVKCSIFTGTPGQCKIAVGGVQDCCESTGGIGLGSYIQMIKLTNQLRSAVSDVEKAKDTPGLVADMASGWRDLVGNDAADIVSEGVSWISEPFTNFVDNISGSISDFFSPVDTFVDQLISQLEKKCTEALANIFREAGMDAAADAIASSAASETTSQAAGQTAAGAALGFVMWVYTAYVVATMIIQIVWKCEKEEYEMISKRDTKNCHYVGSYCKKKVLGVCIEKRQTYCCFNSPLSRIFNEQIRLQGDRLGSKYNGFGTAKNPVCSGLELDDLDKVDWDRIDLSEWIAILESTGQMPDSSNIDLEALTGLGSKLNVNGDRQNTIERTEDRLNNVDVDGIRNKAYEMMDLDTGYRGNATGAQ